MENIFKNITDYLGNKIEEEQKRKREDIEKNGNKSTWQRAYEKNGTIVDTGKRVWNVVKNAAEDVGTAIDEAPELTEKRIGKIKETLSTTFNKTDASRNEFASDDDYERFLVSNKYKATSGPALDYVKEKAKENNTNTYDYVKNMYGKYNAKLETEALEKQYDEGNLSELQKNDLNNRFSALIDKNGVEADINEYSANVETYNTKATELNEQIQQLKLDLEQGKIDDQSFYAQYNDLASKWDENQRFGESLDGYSTVSGFDYYKWAKNYGKDVSDFEKYAESYDDSLIEKYTEMTSASLANYKNIPMETWDFVRMIATGDEDYMIGDKSSSKYLGNAAYELRSYAYSGLTGFHEWSMQTVESVLPQCFAAIDAMAFLSGPLRAAAKTVAQTQLGKFTTLATATTAAKAVDYGTSLILAQQNALEVTKQRLEEGADIGSAVVNGILHGVITKAVEDLNMGDLGGVIVGGDSGKLLLTEALFGKASIKRVLSMINQTGMSEGREEIIEAVLDYFVDTVQNEITNALNGETLNKINVEDLNAEDLANSYVMAYIGAVMMGAPRSVEMTNVVIQNNKMRNGVLSAREHLVDIYNKSTSNEVKELAKAAISMCDSDLGNEKKTNSANDAFTNSKDDVKTVSLDEALNNLVNYVQGDVQDDVKLANEALSEAYKLEMTVQNALEMRGYSSVNKEINDRKGIDAQTYINLTNEEKEAYKSYLDQFADSPLNIKIDDKYNDNGQWKQAGEYLNGVNIKGNNIVINPKAADIVNNGEKIIAATMAHEITHFAQTSKEGRERLLSAIKEELGEKYDEEFEKRKKQYEGVAVTKEDIEDEVMAKYIENNLGNKEFLEKIIEYSDSVFKRIASLSESLRNKNPGENHFKVQDAFMQAYFEASAIKNTSDIVKDGSIPTTVINGRKMGVSEYGQANGAEMTIADDNHVKFVYDGKIIDGINTKCTPQMIEKSPIGASLQQELLESNGSKISVINYRKKLEFFAESINIIASTNDPQLFWALSGSIGFSPTNKLNVSNEDLDPAKTTSTGGAIKSNSDQYGKTFDVTTICLKTQQLINVCSKLMVEKGKALSRDEIIDVVYQVVYESGEPVPCPVCFVFSRWVGMGGVLQEIKDAQVEFGQMPTEEVKERFKILEKEVNRIKDKETKKNGDKLSNTDAINKVQKNLVNEKELLEKKYNEAKLLGKNMTEEEVARLDEIEKELSVMGKWSWIKNIRLADDWVGDPNAKNSSIVPDDILFDLNKGEEFASRYPKAWAHRKSKGSGAGKTPTPYSAHSFGHGYLAEASANAIDKLGKMRKADGNGNTFLKEVGAEGLYNLLENYDSESGDFDLNTELNGKSVKSQIGFKNKATIEKIRSARANARAIALMGGERLQSTSDTRTEFLMDYIMYLTELEGMSATAQMYTKVAQTVSLMASSGVDVNCSLMASGKGYHEVSEGTDGAIEYNGKYYLLDYSIVNGMNPKDAFTLQKNFDSAQSIIVATNKTHFALCLKKVAQSAVEIKNEFLTMIIPFHASGAKYDTTATLMQTTGETISPSDRFNFEQFQTDRSVENPTDEQLKMRELRSNILTGNAKTLTSEQTELLENNVILKKLWERFYVKGTDDMCYGVKFSKKQAEHIFPFEYWDKKSTIETADVNGKIFIDYCKSMGLTARFSDVEIDGEYVGDMHGYWTTLIDRKMYDNNGKYREQSYIDISDMSIDWLNDKHQLEKGIVQPAQMYEIGKRDSITDKARTELEKYNENQEEYRRLKNERHITNMIKERNMTKYSFSEGGYKGYSMSNRAVNAYEEGKKPLSKFNSSDLDYYNDNVSDEMKLSSVSELKKLVELKSDGEWHHTGKFYNRTNFYDVEDAISKGSVEDVKKVKSEVSRLREENRNKVAAPKRLVRGHHELTNRQTKNLNALREEIISADNIDDRISLKEEYKEMLSRYESEFKEMLEKALADERESRQGLNLTKSEKNARKYQARRNVINDKYSTKTSSDARYSLSDEIKKYNNGEESAIPVAIAFSEEKPLVLKSQNKPEYFVGMFPHNHYENTDVTQPFSWASYKGSKYRVTMFKDNGEGPESWRGVGEVSSYLTHIDSPEQALYMAKDLLIEFTGSDKGTMIDPETSKYSISDTRQKAIDMLTEKTKKRIADNNIDVNELFDAKRKDLALGGQVEKISDEDVAKIINCYDDYSDEYWPELMNRTIERAKVTGINQKDVVMDAYNRYLEHNDKITYEEFKEMYRDFSEDDFKELYSKKETENLLEEEDDEFPRGVREETSEEKWINDTQEVVDKINNITGEELTVDDIDDMIHQRGMTQRTLNAIQETKDIMIENAQKWVFGYDPLRAKYPLMSENTFNKSMYEILALGGLEEDTKESIRNFLYNKMDRFLDFRDDNASVNRLLKADQYVAMQLDQFVNDTLKAFEYETKYKNGEADTVTLKKAIRTNTAYDSQDIKGEFDKQKKGTELDIASKDLKERLRQKYVSIVEDTVRFNSESMETSKKGKVDSDISQWATIDQNIDRMCHGNVNLRNRWHKAIRTDLLDVAASQISSTLRSAQKNIDSIKDLGINQGSDESAAVQFYLEGHTNVKEDGKWVKFTESDLISSYDYEMPNGRKAYENIKDAANILRDEYDRYYFAITKTQLDANGDVEGQAKAEIEEKKIEVETIGKALQNIISEIRRDGLIEDTVEAYEIEKKKLNREIKEYNNLIDRYASHDLTRRNLTPYRENFSHHVYDTSLKNTIRSIFDAQYRVPTEVAGITDITKPNTRFNTISLEQTGAPYVADAVRSYAEYSSEASRILAYNPVILNIRQICSDIVALTEGDELNKFKTYLTDYANMLAGKRSEIDRWAQKAIGEKGMKILQTLNSYAKGAALAFNFRSGLVQFANIPNGLSILQQRGGKEYVKDVANGIKRYIKNKSVLKQSAFLNNRFFSFDTGDKRISAKLDDVATAIITIGDKVGAETIWMSAYEQGQRLNVKNAVLYADDVTRRAIAGRSLEDMSLGMKSQVINLLLPFQVENINMFENLRYAAAEKYSGAILTYTVAAFIFNAIIKHITGGDDEVLPDFITPIYEEMKKALNDGQDASETSENILLGEIAEFISLLPFGSQATQLVFGDEAENVFADYNPNRYGLTNIGLSGIGNMIADMKKHNDDPRQQILDVIDNIVGGYVKGGKQIMRTVEGLQSMGGLPDYKNGNIETSPINYTSGGNVAWVNNQSDIMDWIRATLFGKWTTKGAQDYLDNGKGYSDKDNRIFNLLNGLSGDSAYENFESVNTYKVSKTSDNGEKTLREQLLEENRYGSYKDAVVNEYENYIKDFYSSDNSGEPKSFTEFAKSYGITSNDLKLDTYGDFYTTYGVSDDAQEKFSNALDIENSVNAIGKTIKNSAAVQRRVIYEEAGIYDQILEYIENNGLEYSDFGLNATVVNYDGDDISKVLAKIEGKDAETGSSVSDITKSARKSIINKLKSNRTNVFSGLSSMTSAKDAKDKAEAIRKKYR